MPVINRSPINTGNGNDHYETLVERKTKAGKNYDTLKDDNCIPIRSSILIQ